MKTFEGFILLTCERPALHCNVRRQLTVCAVAVASGKADTMVGLFFCALWIVDRGSEEIRGDQGIGLEFLILVPDRVI